MEDEKLATATVAPVLSIKTSSNYGILPWLFGLLAIVLLQWFLWSTAGDIREAEVVARYDKLAIEDADKKLTDGKQATEVFTAAKEETKIRYITKTKEILKYVETPEAKEAAINCKLSDDFIRLYND
jgi:hypothetical protein